MGNDLGQYFTVDPGLHDKVLEFICNSPEKILEPSVGRGDLVLCVRNKYPSVKFKCYEIDETLDFLIKKRNIEFGDFLKKDIKEKYTTIIGNPPFVRTKTGNLYISFIEKCYNLLEDNGELIFIIPSDFFKLTCASKLLSKMVAGGNFTHIYHPESETLFEGANINVVLFRFQKTSVLSNIISYNDRDKVIYNSNGMLTFHDKSFIDKEKVFIGDKYDIYVGMVSGKESVFKNKEFGNIKILHGDDKRHEYIYKKDFKDYCSKTQKYLIENKNELINRRIKNFNENNWYDWGAPRNINVILQNTGKECIYIKNITRDNVVSFKGKVEYFGGGLLLMIPKDLKRDLDKDVEYLNSKEFKNNFLYSGRFRIGHKQLKDYFLSC